MRCMLLSFGIFLDIDECDEEQEEEGGLCPGECRNTIGSYICIDIDADADADADALEPVNCSRGYLPDSGNICQGEMVDVIPSSTSNRIWLAIRHRLLFQMRWSQF